MVSRGGGLSKAFYVQYLARVGGRGDRWEREGGLVKVSREGRGNEPVSLFDRKVEHDVMSLYFDISMFRCVGIAMFSILGCF